MSDRILTAATMHHVRSAAELVSYHFIFLRQSEDLGAMPHDSTERPRAFINHGRWLARCVCDAANATHPDWAIACCFGCGAIHRGVVFPPTRAELEAAERGTELLPDSRDDIEASLLARRRRKNRNWHPGETVQDLDEQTAEHEPETTTGGTS